MDPEQRNEILARIRHWWVVDLPGIEKLSDASLRLEELWIQSHEPTSHQWLSMDRTAQALEITAQDSLAAALKEVGAKSIKSCYSGRRCFAKITPEEIINHPGFMNFYQKMSAADPEFLQRWWKQLAPEAEIARQIVLTLLFAE